MLTRKICDHTTRYRYDLLDFDSQLCHCNWPEQASELFYAPWITRELQNFALFWKKYPHKLKTNTHTLFKSLRYHLLSTPSSSVVCDVVWFDLTKSQIPSKLLISLVSDSRGYSRAVACITLVLNTAKMETKLKICWPCSMMLLIYVCWPTK